MEYSESLQVTSPSCKFLHESCIVLVLLMTRPCGIEVLLRTKDFAMEKLVLLSCLIIKATRINTAA